MSNGSGGYEIRLRRVALRLSRRAAAERAGISDRSWGRFEEGAPMNVRSLRAVESVIGPLEEESRSEVETLNDRVSKLEQQVRRLSAELGIDSEIS